MSIFKCKMCGGTLEIQPNATVAECEYCGTTQTLPKLDDGRKANLFDRANHFRRNNEFDKAAGIYEQILNEDGSDAETYWSLVLCRYGIEYVEDPATHKRVPTVNRAQFTSIFDDDNYKSALNYADGYQRSIYEDEAKAINEIQKGILAISQKEEPFDVFICYKETDNSGRRTPDSVLATDLYHQLTQEGFKVFFSRITLEDKLGTAYEPYIFAALNSAKVMVVLGTKPEYFNAVWVKNEWSRYLALIKSGAKKLLIPAYKDMDPYDLPEEFSHLQAQDMSKLGFMQDLIRGVKKILAEDAPKPASKETVVINAGNANTAALLERVFMFLEDGDWQNADEYCERVLDADPKNAEAYLGKLMAELGVSKKTELVNCKKPFDKNNSYQKVLRFADNNLCDELRGYLRCIEERNEHERLEALYRKAIEWKEKANSEWDYELAADHFADISGYRDADTQKKNCLVLAEAARKNEIYADAEKVIASRYADIEELEKAVGLYQSVHGWKDADAKLTECQQRIEKLKADAENERLEKVRKAELEKKAAQERVKKIKKIVAIAISMFAICVVVSMLIITVVIPNKHYQEAVSLMETEQYKEAIVAFGECGDYKDTKDRVAKILINLAVKPTIAAGVDHIVGLKANGTVVAMGKNNFGQCDVSEWTDIIAVAVGINHSVGLKANGTVTATGNNAVGQCNVSGWADIVTIVAGYNHTVGLKADGTVVVVGNNNRGQCDVSEWTDIIAIAAGVDHSVGLKADGTVVAVGYNKYGQCNVSKWTDIVAVAAGAYHTVGLKADGTVVAVGNGASTNWVDIVAVSAGYDHIVGLKADGTVVAVGNNGYGQCDVSNWANIVAVAAGAYHTVGLKADGTLVAAGNGVGVSTNWVDIKVPE